MKKWIYISLAAVLFSTCQKPEIEIVDFDTFHVTDVKYSDVIIDGAMNPEIRTMELGDENDAKTASTSMASLVENLIATMQSNKVIQIVGTYTGQDINEKPITLSGKVILPAKGKIKNMIVVSHWTIGSNRECPSESFQLEGILASKGYAVVMADYIGYGVTADRIHPYMHISSTARSVVDMALAVKPYLKAIGREPESEEVILVGYSQGGSTTLGAMNIIQNRYNKELPIKEVYAGGGPYDMAATFDIAMLEDKTGIPCAIPMIVQGLNEGDDLDLNLNEFFKPVLLEHLDEWVNSKKYSVGEINAMLNAHKVSDLMTDVGRGSFTDYYCYQGNRQLNLKTLASDKDFKLIVFQINPKNHEIIGEPIVREFHTKPVPHRDLHFQVNFVADELHITPSDDNLTYFWDYDETEMISSTYDNAPLYLYTLAGMYQGYGFMEFYYYDGPCVWYPSLEDNMTDGTEYTLVIAGCEEGELTTAATVVKFIYHPDNIEMLSIEEVNGLGSGRLRNNSRQMESRTTAAPSSRLSLPGKARASLARNGRAHD